MKTRMPSYAIAKIEQLRDRYYSALAPYLRQFVTGDDVFAVSREFKKISPKVSEVVFAESLRTLAGSTLSHTAAVEAAWRLAGNHQTLVVGNAVQPWMRQRSIEWVPGQVRSATFYRSHGKPGYNYSVQILAGTSCPRVIQPFWTSAFTYVLARRLGCSASWGKVPFRHPLELVNMRMMFRIVPEKCNAFGPGFDLIEATSSMKSHNQLLVNARRRINFTCMLDWDRECHACPLGYDMCPAAVHPQATIPLNLGVKDDQGSSGDASVRSEEAIRAGSDGDAAGGSVAGD